METNVLTEMAAARPIKQRYCVELEATVSVAIWLDAESEDQAKDIAAQWKPDWIGCHSVSDLFADCSTDNGDHVLQSAIVLDWELKNTVVETMTVEAVVEATADDTE